MARGQQTEKKKKPIKYFDYSLLFLIIFLLCFGLVMLYSTSSYAGSNKFGDASYLCKKTVVCNRARYCRYGISYRKSDYHVLDEGEFRWRIWQLLCSVLPLFLLVQSANGQARWLKMGPLSFQPSEFAKFAVIIFLATVIYKTPQKMGELHEPCQDAWHIVLPIVAVVAYNNLSTAIIILWNCSLYVVCCQSEVFPLCVDGSGSRCGRCCFHQCLRAYRMDRIKIWLNPEAYEKGYQTLQGLYAIGSGGLFGKGLGESMQKLGFVPEAQNDMIFSVICEELGLFGAVCVILLFLLMIWRFMVIANNASDLYGALVVVGIMAHIAIQVILNIAVVTNTIPNTGISLPFISYGGTSVLFLLAEMGLALSVAKGIQFEVN